jgi:hypothetical protein
MSVPTLPYGSECWTINKKQESQIEIAEMRFLLSCRLQNRIIRNQAYGQELNMFSILYKIVNYQMILFHCMERIDNGRFVKRYYHFVPKGRKRRDTPHKQWRGQLCAEHWNRSNLISLNLDYDNDSIFFFVEGSVVS